MVSCKFDVCSMLRAWSSNRLGYRIFNECDNIKSYFKFCKNSYFFNHFAHLALGFMTDGVVKIFKCSFLLLVYFFKWRENEIFKFNDGFKSSQYTTKS